MSATPQPAQPQSADSHPLIVPADVRSKKAVTIWLKNRFREVTTLSQVNTPSQFENTIESPNPWPSSHIPSWNRLKGPIVLVSMLFCLNKLLKFNNNPSLAFDDVAVDDDRRREDVSKRIDTHKKTVEGKFAQWFPEIARRIKFCTDPKQWPELFDSASYLASLRNWQVRNSTQCTVPTVPTVPIGEGAGASAAPAPKPIRLEQTPPMHLSGHVFVDNLPRFRYSEPVNPMSQNASQWCEVVLRWMMDHRFAFVFLTEVNEAYNDKYCDGRLDLQRYERTILQPICLNDISDKLKSSGYKNAHDFADDVKLLFTNAMIFNVVGEDIHTLAVEFLTAFNISYKSNIECKLEEVFDEIVEAFIAMEEGELVQCCESTPVSSTSV